MKIIRKKTTFRGKTFDSKKECEYYKYLLALKKSGSIKKIELQPKYILMEGFTHKAINSVEFSESKFKHNQIKGKIRDMTYTADFKVTFKDGKEIVIDVKPSKTYKTEVYKLKKKIFLKQYPEVDFFEVY